MADQQLPHNDPDRQLARKLGQARSGGMPLDELDDPLILTLLQYRQQSHGSRQPDEPGKEEVWQKITASTSPANNEVPISYLFSSKNFRWAAAAVVLIGVLFSFLYVQFWQQPELLAQSGASIKTVQLSDGSKVTMRPHSKLLAVEESPSALMYELQGEAHFEVTPKHNRSFSVQTETGRVSVLGTRFMLSTWGDRMQVFLEEGSVEVKALQKDSTVVLKPGESASIDSAGRVSQISEGNPEEFTDWLDRQLIFENKPARQVISELEQQFNISILLTDTIAGQKLSGRLSLKNLQTSLDDLTLVLGGTFVQTGNRSYKFEPN